MSQIILDAHFDVLLDVLHFRSRGEEKVLETRHLPALRAAGINVQICSIFVSDRFLPEMALRNALDQISALREDISESPAYFALCLNTVQARQAVGDGKIALFLSFEGVEPLGSDILLLRTFYDLGVRLVGLTWSRRNYAADGAIFLPGDAPKLPGGLTKFGREVVRRAQELGMVIDVSHLNDPGFFEVAELMDDSFIASHSNCRALCSSARNLTDEQIRTIAKSGGVIGMNSYAPFSADDPEERISGKLLEHLAYIGETVGYEHVGLGLDLCDCVEAIGNRPDAPAAELDLFLNYAEAAEKFIRPIQANFSPAATAGILGGNFMRVLEKVLG